MIFEKKTYRLLDVQVGAACTPNANANVVQREILPGKATAMLVKGRGKHHVPVVFIFINV